MIKISYIYLRNYLKINNKSAQEYIFLNLLILSIRYDCIILTNKWLTSQGFINFNKLFT